ncbi:MAG: hypothetical protein GXY85_09170 [Candidatus Brocadiaceae bacterium]|nr:hypothetical protein [Candidatus Brocadiaceae bacterium]
MNPLGRSRLLCTAVLAFVAAGCSQLDLGATIKGEPWSDARASVERVEEDRRLRQLASVLAAWEEERPEGDQEYRLGAGDVLRIQIFGLQTADGSTSLQLTVSGDGTIALPYVGALDVGGCTVRQVEDRVRAAYAEGYLRNPQVSLEVVEYRSAYVTVAGAVGKAGVYPLKRGPSTVLECLAEAGGLARDAGDEVVLMRPREPGTRGQLTRIDLRELIDRGNLLVNLPVRAGDIVTVPPRVERYVYVLGYVRSAGAFKVESGRTVDAVRAVAMAGGLTNTGRAANCYLVRKRETGEEAFKINLKKVVKGDLPPLYLQPGDVLVVGTDFWGKASEIWRPSLNTSMSASASVVP